MSSAPVPTRRERLREQTLREIREHADAQLQAGGAEAVSLNAIARAMGMSGPALYRYFGSRDELLATLAADAYGGLADTLEAALHAARRRAPAARLRSLARTYRDWALAHPHRYALLAAPAGGGQVLPDEVIPAATRSMELLLSALAGSGDPAAPVADRTLDRQLRAWASSRGSAEAEDTALLRLGVSCWVRLNGLVGLELSGAFAAMGLDGARLLDAEVDAILGELRSG